MKKSIFIKLFSFLLLFTGAYLFGTGAAFLSEHFHSDHSSHYNDSSQDVSQSGAVPVSADGNWGLSFQEDDKYKASYEYTLILSDAQTKSETFTSLFKKVRAMMKENKRGAEKSLKQYSEELCKKLYSVHPDIELIYNKTYISILIACITISEMRRS